MKPPANTSGVSIMRWASNGSEVCRRAAAITSGPKVRLGTNCPSITSHWMRSQPAASSAATSSPRRAKSTGSTDGTILIRGVIAGGYRQRWYRLVSHQALQTTCQDDGVSLTPVIHPEVQDALAGGRAVVALETTIFSHLGLPSPANREALDRCLAAVRAGGAVPAVTAVLDGTPRVGIDQAEHARICAAAQKAAERDLAVAVARGWAYGATTVSASLALADRAGISVFATGGIGGVHRGAEITGDVSADLDAIAHHPVVTVCAGAKAFLDLARTLEYLETVGVPVLGWRHDWFPAFYTRSSGLPAPHRVEDAATVAAVLGQRARPDTGVLLTVPIPAAAELDSAALDEVLAGALADAEAKGVTGAAVTPFVLVADR